MAVFRMFLTLCAAALLVTAALSPVEQTAAAQDNSPAWVITAMGFTGNEGQLLDTARDPLTGDLWVSFMVNDPPGIAVCQQTGAGGDFGGGDWHCSGPFDIGDRGSSPSSIDIFHTEDEFRVGLVYLTQERFAGNEIVYRTRECSLDEPCQWSDAEIIVRDETDIDNPEYSNYRYLNAQIKFGRDGTPYVPFVLTSVLGEIEVAALAHPSAFSQSCLGTVSNWTCTHVAETLGIYQVDIDIDAENNIYLIHYGYNGWQYMKYVGAKQGNCWLARDFDCSLMYPMEGFFSLDVPWAGDPFPNRFALILNGKLYLAEEPGSDCSTGAGVIWDVVCTEIEAVGSDGEPYYQYTNNPHLTSDWAGRPVIAYKDYDHPADSSLKVAAPLEVWQEHRVEGGICGGGSWRCITIANGVDSEVAIEIDGSGRPTVFYYDPGSHRLMLARLVPSVPGADGNRTFLPLVMN